MKKIIGIFILGYLFFPASCNKDEGKKPEKKQSSFKEIYEFSEMALLMEDMYSDMEKIRPNVIENKNIGALPPNLIKIHTAKMTNTFERTFEFERFANLLIETQKQLYDSKSNVKKVDLYNNVVNACLVCHKSPVGCDGPIPRIQGLLIK
ncbi:hypothetical protein [Moheibacter sediminis]|uniref:Cytochrome C n=1 Tax=Moheibacter sediminis TaxID=1434700 RepID=A0A1W2D308_9FLAO|nr:hypothetical protein [Moheibacter sediminis]SMC91434.1 hypothetical protein SAMN06296427_1142 [Moheibacter sediminis]